MKRLVLLFFVAIAAYLISLQFIFPGYIALPQPFHNDMYWAIGFVAKGWTFPFFLHWPRPVFYETLLLAGHLGLEGSLISLTAIAVFDLALALTLLERFLLRTRIPVWLAFLTFLVAMAGPGFYGQPAFDVGFHLAMLFGLFGMWAWEARSTHFWYVSWLVAAACFCASTLSNEGFIPVLAAYGVACAVRERHWPLRAGGVAALPLVAIAASFADGQITHSTFVSFHTAASDPYHIDFSLGSVLGCTAYYISGFFNPAFVALALICGVGVWRNGRLRTVLVIVCCALALYAPYAILPNHITDIYQWAAMPVLMLLAPLAWSAPGAGLRNAAVFNAGLAVVLVGAITFQTTQYTNNKSWYRTTLAANRAIIATLRAHAGQIAAAHRVLVQNVAFVMNPWEQNADSLSQIVPFTGEWDVETARGIPPIEVQRDARPVAGSTPIRGYDLVLRFSSDGRLVTIH